MQEIDVLAALRELQDRQAIAETLTNYCRYVDRNDPAALSNEVFAEDGCFELGAKYAVIGAENLRRMFARTLCVFSATSHHVSNIVIRMTGADTAESTAYVYAWHRNAADGKRIDLWGRYHDQHRRTPAGWRIQVRRLTVAGTDGWDNPPFDVPERLPNPTETLAPEITRR